MKKTIIITGAAGNLGKTVTDSLLNEGYNIHALMRLNSDSAHDSNPNLNTYDLNLLDVEATKKFVDNVTAIKGDNVTALICLVGGFAMGTIDETDMAQIEKMIALNFATTYNIVKPLMGFSKKNNKPLQLIFIGSRPALEPQDGNNYVGYTLGKSLLFRLAEFINTDSNTTNITASVIVPSTLDTPATRSSMPDADPLNWVPTDSVASTISFILSDAGKMMRSPIYKLYNKA